MVLIIFLALPLAFSGGGLVAGLPSGAKKDGSADVVFTTMASIGVFVALLSAVALIVHSWKER